MTDFISEYGNILFFIIGLAGLAGFIWRAFQWLNQQQQIKEDKRLAIEEEKAKIVKDDIDKRAIKLKEDTEEVADDVKKEVEMRAEVIKREIEGTARNLRDYTEQVSKELIKKLSDVDEKFARLIEDLSKRADMTNGNVKMIRNEIADVQDDVQSLWEVIEDNNTGSSSKQRRQQLKPKIVKRRGIQARESRAKRSQIETDSQDQEMIKHRY